MYWHYPAVNGEVITIYLPSSEEYQHTVRRNQQTVLAEMYFLGLTDKLITSSWSTSGYLVQSHGADTVQT